MDSQLPETPTPARRSASSAFSGVHLNYYGDEEDSQYALPSGIPGSSQSCAFTSASSSVKDGYSTPSRGHRGGHTTPSGSTHDNPASRRINNGYENTFVPLEAQVSKLKNDLETNYSIQCNHRLQKLLIQFPGGVPEEEIEHYKQREAVERTKFVVYKDGQLARLVNELTGGLGSHKDPFIVSPATPTQFRSYQNQSHENLTEQQHFNINTHNPFAVNHSIPPPPRSSRDRSANSNSVSGFSFSELASMSSSLDSGVPDGSQSIVNFKDKNNNSNNNNDVNNAHLPAATETANENADDAAIGLTREQIVAAFSETWNHIDTIKSENKQLQTEISDLKELIVALIGNPNGTDLASRVTALEGKFTPGSNAMLESDDALVAEITAELTSLRNEVANYSSNSVSRRAFNAENELTKLTFNNKFSLIEKYLGIDITTTGPKPHDVLEALHRRIWHLEEFLSIEDNNCKAGKQYHPLNYYMKTTLGKRNAVVSFSATPGYTTSATYNDMTATAGGTAYMPEGIQNSLNALVLSSPESVDPSPPPQEKTWAQLVQAPPPTSNKTTGNDTTRNNHISYNNTGKKTTTDMIVNHAGMYHPTHVSNFALPVPGAANGIIPYYVNTNLPRGTSMPSLLPQGTLADMSPRTNFAHKSRARGNTSRSSLGVTSPRGRKTDGARHHSRTESTSTSTTKANSRDSDKESGKELGKEVAKETNVKGPSPSKTKDRAYAAWLNQRPGEFFGKKLTGLGQKE